MNTQETLRENALIWWIDLRRSEKAKRMNDAGIEASRSSESMTNEEIESLYLKEHPQEFPSLLESGEGKEKWLQGVLEPTNIYIGKITGNEPIATAEDEETAKLICEAVNNYPLLKERIKELTSESNNETRRVSAEVAMERLKKENERLSALNGELIRAIEEIKSMCDGNDTNENSIWHKANKAVNLIISS